jgi:hypothetical protein
MHRDLRKELAELRVQLRRRLRQHLIRREGLLGELSTLEMLAPLQLKTQIDPRRPPLKVVSPKIGSSETEPTEYPEFAVWVEYEACIGCVKVRQVQTFGRVAKQVGAAEEAAGVKFASQPP